MRYRNVDLSVVCTTHRFSALRRHFVVHVLFGHIPLIYMKDAVVEWLVRLVVVRKVAGSSPARVKRLENSHCPPSSKWVAG